MPSMALPTRRGRSGRGRARRSLAMAVGLLVSLAGQGQAQTGVEVGVTKFHTPTWGTNPIEGTPFSARVWDVAVDGDTAYLAGEFTALAPTLTLAGAIDGSSGQPQPGFPEVNDGQVNVAVADGRGGWFVGGSFQKINGITKNGLAHILADGTIDPGWETTLIGPANQPSGSFTVWALAVAGPWVYVGGEFAKFGPKGNVKAATRNHIARVGVSTGTIDHGWDPNADQTVRSIAVTPDGSRVYYAGDFGVVSGVPRAGVAATWGAGQQNGALIDWQPGVGGTSALAVAPDSSRVFVGGSNALAAYDANGAQLWNAPVAGRVASLALSRDGSVLYTGGEFGSVHNQPRNRLAALDAGSGALDSSWNPNADGRVSSVTVADDGSKVYVGGTFTNVRGQERHNLAAVDPTGALDTWNPNADGAVFALSASGAQVYAGGDFKGLGAVPRTYVGAMNIANGSPTNFAPVIQNLDSTGAPKPEPPVVQSIALSADRQKLYIAGIFSHVGNPPVPRANVAAVNVNTGQPDPAFDPGEPQGAVRSLWVRDNRLYIGGDFDSIQIKSTQRGRPDNDRTTCGIAPGSSANGNRCVWQRSKIAILDANTGVLDISWRGPTSTGPGLVGNGGKLCNGQTTQACGTGAVKSIQVSPGGEYIYLGGTFSNFDGQLGILSLYLTGPLAGTKTPWQPAVENRPIYDMKLGPNGALYAAAGGAGGRIFAWTPHTGSATPTWAHLFDGDSTAVAPSANAVYSGGHYDFVDGGAFRRKHAAAFDLNGNLAMNFDPEMDTSEGVFTAEVVPDRMVIFGGNFSRVNRRPQPGYAQFAGRP